MKELSEKTAARIWSAHREIDTAEKLRKEIAEGIKGEPSRYMFGHHGLRSCELTIPQSESGGRLYRVGFNLALTVIEAHIAEMRRELTEASIAALVELGDIS